MCGRLLRSSLALTILALVALLAPAAASVVPRPVLGDWEGVGPHGLPLSFVLAKPHKRVVIRNLVIGFPVACSSKPAPWVVEGFDSSYAGPGAPFRIRYRGWTPRDIEITAFIRGQFPLIVYGRLKTRRHAAVSMHVSPQQPKNCGWPRKLLTWRVRPRKRVAVPNGTWTGPLTLPEGTGTVTVKVKTAGRIVDLFKVDVTCPGPGGGGIQAGPPAGEFVAANGSFKGAALSDHWQGRFAADGVLTGTFVSPDSCGQVGQVTGTFTAHRSAP